MTSSTQKQALIFWGGWEGHTPERSATITKGLLERHGFAVRVEHGTKVLTEAELGKFDLIVPMITMATIAKEEVTALCDAVRGGVGLGGFHGLMCDAFRNETEYQFMTGGQWVAHPGNIIDFRVNVKKADDPVMRGIADFPFRSEQYYMHVDPAIEVLATTTFDGTHCDFIKGVVMPVVWKKHYGKGRVFYSALGHTADEFASPEMTSIVERGLLWAAR
ncbi:MAG: ThuA domain-containing protein [Alphaproteobacteria bacterium]|nr:ThuA domain-containing protein [Alphaproteobacteria bacterium]